MEGWPGIGGKTVHIDFRGWSRSSKITIAGTRLRCNYRFVFRCSKKAGEARNEYRNDDDTFVTFIIVY